MITSKSQTLSIAKNYFNHVRQYDDSSMIGPWRSAVLGDPILVRSVKLEASFWIVPVERSSRALGYISIGPDGRVLGYAYLYQSPNDLSVCPSVATRIKAEEARELANDLLKRYIGNKFSDPVFVHDGPYSRLAWMIEVRAENDLVSRVFITPGYAYERRIGNKSPSLNQRGGLAQR